MQKSKQTADDSVKKNPEKKPPTQTKSPDENPQGKGTPKKRTAKNETTKQNDDYTLLSGNKPGKERVNISAKQTGVQNADDSVNTKPKEKNQKKSPGKSMAGNEQQSFKNLLETDKTAFCEWFFTSTNGNELIDGLNEYDGQKVSERDYVRREKHRPHIYGVVLDYDFGGSLGNWRFCKVGITLVERKSKDNRVDIVEKKIHNQNKPNYNKTECIFYLPIRAIDTSNIYNTERRIRRDMGFNVHKDLAKKLDLPVKTEWALTTEDFITKVVKEAKEIDATTYIFKDKLSGAKHDVKAKKPPPKIKYGDDLIINTTVNKTEFEDGEKICWYCYK